MGELGWARVTYDRFTQDEWNNRIILSWSKYPLSIAQRRWLLDLGDKLGLAVQYSVGSRYTGVHVLENIRFSGGVPTYTRVSQNTHDIEAKRPITGKGEINTWLPHGRSIARLGEVDPH